MWQGLRLSDKQDREEYSLESEKFSFRTNDAVIIATLQSKAQSNEMSNYINEALRFYRDNASELTEIKLTLVQIKEMLSCGVITEQMQVVPVEENEMDLDTTSQLFMNSLDVFG